MPTPPLHLDHGQRTVALGDSGMRVLSAVVDVIEVLTIRRHRRLIGNTVGIADASSEA